MKLTKKCFSKFLKHFTSFSLLLFTMLLLINFSFINNTNVANASWLDKADEGGLKQIGDVYGQNKDKPSQIIIVVASIINVSLGLLGIIFLILLLYAGFNWMTAGGDEEKIKTASETITRAVIGLIIILASWAIAKFVVSTIISASTKP